MESICKDLRFHVIALLSQHVKTLHVVRSMTHDRLAGQRDMVFRAAFREQRGDRCDTSICKAHEALIVCLIALNICPSQSRRGADIGVVLRNQLDILISGVVAENGADEVGDRHALGVLSCLFQHIGSVLHHHGDEACELVRTGKRLVKLPVIDRQRLFVDFHAVEVFLLNQRLGDHKRINSAVVHDHSRINCRIVDKGLVNSGELSRDVAVLLLCHFQTAEFAGVRPDREDRSRKHLRDSRGQRIIAGFQRFLSGSHKAGSIYGGKSSRTSCLCGDRVKNSRKLIKSKVICHVVLPPYLITLARISSIVSVFSSGCLLFCTAI